jgi:RNA recognition motif-containing protein
MTQTLYVGNLPPEVDQEALHLLFSRYGTTSSVTLKGTYGFVVYENAADAEKALTSLNGKYLAHSAKSNSEGTN